MKRNFYLALLLCSLGGLPSCHQAGRHQLPSSQRAKGLSPSIAKHPPPADRTVRLEYSADPAIGKGTPDIRERLLSSFRRGDEDFAHTDSYKLTHFSYLGKLTTAKGRVYVCEARWVIQGMRAPRGFAFILFCDQRFHYLGKIRFYENRPLWCEQGKLYLFGDLAAPSEPGWSNCPHLSEQQREGNVIDVSEGFDAMRIYHKKVYGSSGGVNDN